MARSPYEVLGVDRGASADEIRKAFRQLAAQHHPDRNPGNPAAEGLFKEVNAAYQVLSDPGRRAAHDNPRPSGFGTWGPNANGDQFASMYADILKSTFRNRGRNPFTDPSPFDGFNTPPRAGQGGDVEVELQVTAEESVTGCKRQMEIRSQKAVPCQACAGAGSAKGSGREVCGTCAGKGKVVNVDKTFSGRMGVQACPACRGRGTKPAVPCGKCAGAGTRRFDREVAVAVPAGIADGMRLRLAGMGIPGSPPGDLYVTVRIGEASGPGAWSRDGADLVTRRTLSLRHAVLGGPLTVTLPDGKELRVEVPPGTQPGDELALRGQGVRHASGKAHGDVRVVVTVAVPRDLSPRGLRLLDELMDEVSGVQAS